MRSNEPEFEVHPDGVCLLKRYISYGSTTSQMTRIAGKTERNVRTRLVKVSLSLAAALALLSLSALPAYAWTSYPGTTTLAHPTIVLGGSTTDSAPLKLTADGVSTSPASCLAATSYGCIIFKVYAGTCASYSGAALFTNIVQVTSASQGAYFTYVSAAYTPVASGSYVWVDTYSGTTGANPYPSNTFACELFTVNTPSHGVPEFPMGLPALLALALPLMILLRRKLPSQ
jgi:hypothetical protein